ncbi:hypothetical protein AY536_10895, partial [Corynebacterium diphtheriae bv. mitis]|uniref:hypothetical protein n=2 Tax=Corynebacterium diphtheriae TaxID=1717 RepID=UPI000B4B7A6F
MFKRSLASVAAVAIASGAVVAPANAVAVRVHDDKTCTLSLTAEETKLTSLHSGKYPQEKITTLKSTIVGSQPSALRKQIKKNKEELTKPILDEERRKDLTSKLKENEKKLTVYENLNNALDACINGKYYNSDQPDDSKKPEDQGNPGAPGNPGDSNNPGAPGNPGDSNNPEGPKKPGGTEKPKAPSNPGATPAPPSNDGAGIGVIFAGAIAAILGILAAALPIIKPML